MCNQSSNTRSTVHQAPKGKDFQPALISVGPACTWTQTLSLATPNWPWSVALPWLMIKYSLTEDLHMWRGQLLPKGFPRERFPPGFNLANGLDQSVAFLNILTRMNIPIYPYQSCKWFGSPSTRCFPVDSSENI